MTGRRASAAAFAALLLVPAAAHGAGEQGLQLAPSRIEATVRAGDRLPAVVITNGSDRRVVVDVAAVPAGQELSGLPTFTLDRASLRAGRRVLRVAPRRLELAAGASRRLRPRVVGGPTAGRGAYMVIVATARQLGGEEGRAVVTPLVRLTANILLRYRGRVRLRGALTGFRVAQGVPAGTKRTLDFALTVANRGTIHRTLRTRLTVRDASGRIVLRGRFPRGTVLPSAERELVRGTRRPQPAGEYTATARAWLGGRRMVREVRFRLSDTNLLPSSDLQIAGLRTDEHGARRPVDVELDVANRGSAPGAARGDAELSLAGSGSALEHAKFRTAAIAAGGKATVHLKLPAARRGELRLAVRLLDGDRVLDQRITRVAIGERPALWVRLLDWIAAHVPVVLAMFGALLLAVLAGAVALVRRERRRALRPQRIAAAPAPAPEPVPSGPSWAPPPVVARATPVAPASVPLLASAPHVADPHVHTRRSASALLALAAAATAARLMRRR